MRIGNVTSAYDCRSMLARYRHRTGNLNRYLGGDAGFANPEVYEFLEAEGYLYTIRFPANTVLHQGIQHLMTRCVLAKVEWHKDELFHRVGFTVTNLGGGAAGVTWFYDGRGYGRAVPQSGQSISH